MQPSVPQANGGENIAESVKFIDREVIGINWRLLLYCFVPLFMNVRVYNEVLQVHTFCTI